MIQLQWHAAHSSTNDPTEYLAELPSGGRVVIRLHDGVWVATTKLRHAQEEREVYATARDAQAAVEAAEEQRLIALATEISRNRDGLHVGRADGAPPRAHGPSRSGSHRP